MRQIFKVLLSPWVVLAGAVLGFITGTEYKEAVVFLKPIGDIYLSLLQMCVIPIMCVAILTSIGQLVKSNTAGRSIARLVQIFIVMFVLTSVCSIAISMASKPYVLSDKAKQAMGTIVIQHDTESVAQMGNQALIKEIDSRHGEDKDNNRNILSGFFINMIPKNIFYSLVHGEIMKIIFFFIILGVMMKFISHDASEAIMDICRGLYEALQKAIKLMMYMLPFGLWALTAEQFASSGAAMVSSLFSLAMLVSLALMLLFLVFTLVLWLCAGGSYFRQFRCLGEVILLCVGTQSSFAAIPSAIAGTARIVGESDERIGLAIPLGVTLCRYGDAAVFSVAAVFAMQLYGFAITPQSILLIVVTASFAAMATSGAPGVISITMLSMVLAPLGVPAAAMIIILIALDPVLDPIVTLVNVYPSCVAAALLARNCAQPKKQWTYMIM